MANLLLALFEQPSRSVQTWLTATGRDRELLIDEFYAMRSASSDGERFERSSVLTNAERHATANE